MTASIWFVGLLIARMKQEDLMTRKKRRQFAKEFNRRKINGGGCSHRRTSLSFNFLGNRENNRQFPEFSISIWRSVPNLPVKWVLLRQKINALEQGIFDVDQMQNMPEQEIFDVEQIQNMREQVKANSVLGFYHYYVFDMRECC
jgi:hypothetical protein